MSLVNEVVPGNEAMPGGTLRRRDGEVSKDGSLVAVLKDNSNGQEDRCN